MFSLSQAGKDNSVHLYVSTVIPLTVASKYIFFHLNKIITTFFFSFYLLLLPVNLIYCYISPKYWTFPYLEKKKIRKIIRKTCTLLILLLLLLLNIFMFTLTIH